MVVYVWGWEGRGRCRCEHNNEGDNRSDSLGDNDSVDDSKSTMSNDMKGRKERQLITHNVLATGELQIGDAPVEHEPHPAVPHLGVGGNARHITVAGEAVLETAGFRDTSGVGWALYSNLEDL